MLGAADPELARSAHSWMAEVHWYMLWTSMEPAGGVMNRLRRGRELRLGWPELGLGWPEPTHRWTGTPCRAASLDCSRGE